MRTFDDIVPPSRRSAPDGPFPPPAPPPPPGSFPKRRAFPYLGILIALFVIAACVAVLFYFSGAKIEITPSVTSVPVQSSFTAGAAGDMPFSLLSAKKIATVSIPSTGTKQGNALASGPITIYNQKARPQTLIANTRFLTGAGLIYRIHAAVVVPAGTSSKPGTVSATAYADTAGPTYDIGPSSFTIPGLAGTAQANAVYARSASPMTGGASGPLPVVDASAESSTVASLESSLATNLESTLSDQVPTGYILLAGAATTTYHEIGPTPSITTGKADIAVEATVTGVAFPSSALAGAVASSSVRGASVTLGKGTSLTLAPNSAFPSSNADTFSFSLSGMANLISKVDPMQIATAVAGKSRTEAKVALTNYPEVKRAVLILRPFWRQAFPEDPAVITVVVGDPAP